MHEIVLNWNHYENPQFVYLPQWVYTNVQFNYTWNCIELHLCLWIIIPSVQLITTKLCMCRYWTVISQMTGHWCNWVSLNKIIVAINWGWWVGPQRPTINNNAVWPVLLHMQLLLYVRHKNVKNIIWFIAIYIPSIRICRAIEYFINYTE